MRAGGREDKIIVRKRQVPTEEIQGIFLDALQSRSVVSLTFGSQGRPFFSEAMLYHPSEAQRGQRQGFLSKKAIGEGKKSRLNID